MLVRLVSLSAIFMAAGCGINSADKNTTDKNITDNNATLIQNDMTDKQAVFNQLNELAWQQVLFDSGEQNWRDNWLVDGLVGTIENTPQGMHIKAGPEAYNHAHHIVAWTKQSFSGDIKIDFEYTRTDNAELFVNVLYLLATGEQTPGFDKDIMNWAEHRQEPFMRHYFGKMNTYHISYAAFGLGEVDAPDDYIRARRYMPLANQGLKDTALEGDNINTGFFKTGVRHQVSVIKKGDALWMKVANPEQSQVYYWSTASHPAITEGRIGVRHMFTRSALYRNFTVSTLTH
ncbi:hypothetical protein C2869_06985 [Saccharobesus litoralis]|uniref:DUF1961 family protein n=2 Tax=Saccharobesus litoralis TaxID=2172099 RepID=A0A2S0VPR1_9ALTE|nr:hypothetical protein C2869_06985 [Saccharobesus litoralis]